ncbi:MAG TPA: leucyl aminopeptidase [bacterium]|nr:leucyl aminopeptidase [bacterium]
MASVKLAYQAKGPERTALGVLVLFCSEKRTAPPQGLPAPLARALRQVTTLGEFTGKTGQSQVLFTGDAQVPRLLVLGLGPEDKLEREGLRRAAGKAAQALRKLNVERAGLWVPEHSGALAPAELGEVLAEGTLLGAYTFEPYKHKEEDKDAPKAELKAVTLYDPARATSAASVERGVLRGEAVCLARDLGNQPANAMTPTQLAAEARAVARRHKLKVTVLEQAELEKLGLGMFMGVAKGSRQPPKLILLEYRPARKATQTLAFVGKGITFDSGGISLKPGAAMDEMKFDMCGAAAVLGAMDGIGKLKPNVNVVGIVPTCENLPDGQAVKPGDILKSYAGKHVEVLNTDAEGRLILGDALAYGIERFKPDAVVDLATLTGACVIALGHYATGAVTNDDALLERLQQTGRACGDIVWPLPNFPEYGEALKGKYADLQNIGPREGGAITGGLFLKNFVGEVPWVHLDIAGTAWGVKSVGHVPNDGATGVGVCLLMDLATHWTALDGKAAPGKATRPTARQGATKPRTGRRAAKRE